MARIKDKNLSIRTTTRRAEIIMSYAKQSEKTQTQVLEDFIDSLEVKIKEK